MVLLAAAICTKQGKALVSRQFVEMTRARIEGLLSTFPKLMGSGKQHTFVETESVRFVYQPLERLYMLLITTKTSNILEDLETLRLFSRVIPEYCSSLDEQNILDNAFDLIFAFDEIVALGYRENVNLAQIRTFTEMDSHEEKVYEAMRKSQEKDARDEMKRKAKELQLAKREARRDGRALYTGGYGGGGFGSHDMRGGGSGMGGPTVESLPPADSGKSYNQAPSRSRGSGSAMKLGKKGKDVESFVDKLVAEGERVTSATSTRQPAAAMVKSSSSQAVHESVHLRMSEKLTLIAGRDGGVQNMEVLGIIMLRISDPEYGRIRVLLDNKESRPIQFQTHPNVDKQQFNRQSIIAMKQEGRSFPTNQDVGVLKWRLQTTDQTLMPLSINCWPSENNGKCDVNIEYELLQDYLVLSDVTISIPVPSGVGAPVVGEVDGEYSYDAKKHSLNWRLPLIDATSKEGSMEFTIAAIPEDFFPIKVSFMSSKSYCNIEVDSVTLSETNKPVKYSSEMVFTADKFEIV